MQLKLIHCVHLASVIQCVSVRLATIHTNGSKKKNRLLLGLLQIINQTKCRNNINKKDVGGGVGQYGRVQI